MKRTIYSAVATFFVLLWFSSCKTAQTEVLKTDYEAVNKTKADVTSDVTATNDTKYELENRVDFLQNQLTEIWLKQNTVTLQTDYDTEKPIVPATGKPPVKSEISTKTSSELSEVKQTTDQLCQQLSITMEEVDSIKAVLKDLSDYNEKISAELEQKESSVFWSFSIVIAVLSIAMIIYIKFKK